MKLKNMAWAELVARIGGEDFVINIIYIYNMADIRMYRKEIQFQDAQRIRLSP